MNKTIQMAWVMLLTLLLVGVADARGQRCKKSKQETTPTSDFTVNKNGTVLHKKTGLMWKRCTEGFKGSECETGEASRLFWSDLNDIAKKSSFATYRDWRVPTIDELKSIVEKRCKGPSINLKVFSNTPNISNWSGTEIDEARAWQMYTTSGVAIKGRQQAKAALRLVRTP